MSGSWPTLRLPACLAIYDVSDVNVDHVRQPDMMDNSVYRARQKVIHRTNSISPELLQIFFTKFTAFTDEDSDHMACSAHFIKITDVVQQMQQF